MIHTALSALKYLPRAASGVAGFGFLYMALFMYQDQAGKLHNRLVDLWLRATAKQEESPSKQARFIKASADIAGSGLNWLLGNKLISVQVVVVSFCMSIGSAGILLWLSLYFSREPDPNQRFDSALLLTIGLLHLLYGLFAARVLFKRDRWLLPLIAPVILIVLAGLCALFFSFMNFGFEFPETYVSEFGLEVLMVIFGAAAFGLVCDFLLLAGSRLLIEFVAHTRTRRVLVAGLCLSSAWLFLLLDSMRVLIFGPSVFAFRYDPFVRLLRYLTEPGNQHTSYFLISFAFGVYTNLFNLIASCSILLVLLVVLFHKVFWPATSHVVYALYEWQVFANRKLQLAAAITFLSFAFPWVSGVLKLFQRPG